MDPIGASTTWHWEAYDNAWVEIDGKRMKSVTGGGHFGGGMFISAYDLARFGYLFLQQREVGRPSARVREVDRDGAGRPGPANAGYGFCNWFLNTPAETRGRHPGAAAVPVGAALLDHVPGQRRQHRLHGLGPRPGRRRALDRQQPQPGSVLGEGDRGDLRLGQA